MNRTIRLMSREDPDKPCVEKARLELRDGVATWIGGNDGSRKEIMAAKHDPETDREVSAEEGDKFFSLLLEYGGGLYSGWVEVSA